MASTPGKRLLIVSEKSSAYLFERVVRTQHRAKRYAPTSDKRIRKTTTRALDDLRQTKFAKYSLLTPNYRTGVNSERRRTSGQFGSTNRWRHSQLFLIRPLEIGAEDRHTFVAPLTVSHPKSLFRLRSIASWGIGSSTGKYAAQ
jgi:hypothetical protein